MGAYGIYLDKEISVMVERMSLAKGMTPGKVIQAIVIQYFSRKKGQR